MRADCEMIVDLEELQAGLELLDIEDQYGGAPMIAHFAPAAGGISVETYFGATVIAGEGRWARAVGTDLWQLGNVVFRLTVPKVRLLFVANKLFVNGTGSAPGFAASRPDWNGSDRAGRPCCLGSPK